MDILHEPLVPILRHVLAAAGLPRSGIMLDLASGSGLKLPLLRAACGPDTTILALDHDRQVFFDATHRFTCSPVYLLAADAHALPLLNECIASACCIASWSLFTNPITVLHELRRVIAPGGSMLIISGTQAWAEVTRWTPAIAEQLQAALARAHVDGMTRPSPPDMGDEIADQFAAAGLPAPHVRAFLLDASDPIQAELALLPWQNLRAVVAPYLDGSTLRTADEVAATCDIELCTLVLAAQAIV